MYHCWYLQLCVEEVTFASFQFWFEIKLSLVNQQQEEKTFFRGIMVFWIFYEEYWFCSCRLVNGADFYSVAIVPEREVTRSIRQKFLKFLLSFKVTACAVPNWPSMKLLTVRYKNNGTNRYSYLLDLFVTCPQDRVLRCHVLVVFDIYCRYDIFNWWFNIGKSFIFLAQKYIKDSEWWNCVKSFSKHAEWLLVGRRY